MTPIRNHKTPGPRFSTTGKIAALALVASSIALPTTAHAQTVSAALEDATVFNITSSAEKLELNASNDGTPVKPADLHLTIPDNALTDKTKEFSGVETATYFTPAFGDDYLTFTGAENQLPLTGIYFSKVTGPGKIFLGTGKNDQEFTPVLNTKKATLEAPAALPANAFIDNMAHMLFEKPGKYVVEAEAVEVSAPADLADAKINTAKFKRKSTKQTYTFLVGAAAKAQAAKEAKEKAASDTNGDSTNNTEAANASEQPGADPLTPDGSENTNVATQPPGDPLNPPAATEDTARENTGSTEETGKPAASNPEAESDNSKPAETEKTDSNSANETLGKANPEDTEKSGSEKQDSEKETGANAQTGSPQTGNAANNPDNEGGKEAATTAGEAKDTETNSALPNANPPVPAGKAPAAANGGVISQLGSLLASAKCFPSFEGGKGELSIRPKVKDDRQSPAKWYNFNQISFTIGDAGKAKLPGAVGAIPAAANVWMIGSTQVKDVPWVGANTMSDTVLSQTTGEVTWTLSSFEGPGAMEVFTSGNFGTLVGAKWFSGNGTSANGSVTIPKNTHVHPNWVFSAPGVYKLGITQTATLKDGKKITGTDTLFFQVGGGNGARDGHFDIGSEIAAAGAKRVWKDANGKPCTPNETDLQAAGLGSLATTGASDLTIPITIFGLGMGVLGIGMRLRPRENKN